jgi:hypothetical protein
MPVGFALAYYLIGAVLLDFNAAKLHTMTARGQNMLIGDVSSIPEAVKREVRARRYLYWTMLGRYLFLHVWGLAVASSLLWVFDSTVDVENPLDSPEESAFLFLAYIFSYTGSSVHIPMKGTANISQVYFGIRYIPFLPTCIARLLIYLLVHQNILWSPKPQAYDRRRSAWSSFGPDS